MKRFAFAMIALFLSFAASAQDALLRAQERAKFLSDYQALLNNPDANMRMAAVEEALGGDDDQLRSMALETALASNDPKLQTAALRWYIDSRSQLLVTFVMPERPSDVQKYLYAKWNGLTLKDPKVAANGSEIEYAQYYAAGGQLVRGGMEFSFHGAHHQMGICRLSISPASGTLLTGQFFCTFHGYENVAGANEGALPVRLDLS